MATIEKWYFREWQIDRVKFRGCHGAFVTLDSYECESMYTVKGNCSGKNINFFIPSIDRVCGSDAQGKKLDFYMAV